MSTPRPDYSDEEMLMDMYRIARNGECATAAELKKAIRETWPNEPQERLDRVLQNLVTRLIN